LSSREKRENILERLKLIEKANQPLKDRFNSLLPYVSVSTLENFQQLFL